jgi:hypothetical protein
MAEASRLPRQGAERPLQAACGSRAAKEGNKAWLPQRNPRSTRPVRRVGGRVGSKMELRRAAAQRATAISKAAREAPCSDLLKTQSIKKPRLAPGFEFDLMQTELHHSVHATGHSARHSTRLLVIGLIGNHSFGG